MNDERLDWIFRKSASAALSEWHADQWDLQQELLEDLSQDLWVWYLESKAVQKKLEESDEFLARRLVYKAALQMLSGEAVADDLFHGRSKYSSDCVRDALRGDSTNKYLNQVLPYALDNLGDRNEAQAEAIRSRYDDGEVPVPHSAAEKVLGRAVKSVTEEVNVFYLTSDVDGIGSSSAVFPETRKKQGEHSDPTGYTAVLLGEFPEYRAHFYEQIPMPQFLGGAAAQPVFGLGKVAGKVVRFRRTGSGGC